MFEHSHVRVSYGRTLDRLFYAPYMHHFHHGAGPEHLKVSLGFTGGLILCDCLFGTLHWLRSGEKVVWGASREERGANDPHQSLWVYFVDPFVEAFRVLRAHNPRTGISNADSAECAGQTPRPHWIPQCKTTWIVNLGACAWG
jgi:hypothetical protein